MAEDDRNALPAESREPAGGPIIERGREVSREVFDPYRETGGDLGTGADAGLDLRAILQIAFKRKGVILGSVAAFLACGLLWTLLQKPLYTAAIRLEIGHGAPKILKNGEAATSENDDAEFDTEVELLKTRNLAERVASMLHAGQDLGFQPTAPADPLSSGRFEASRSDRAERELAAGAEIAGGLAVKPVPGTRLVDVSYTGPDPAQAQRIANAFGEAYIASSLDKRFQANAYAKSFLEDQLKQLKLRLEEAEKTELDFAEKEQIVATTDKASIADSNLAAANGALGNLIAERIKNEQLWRQAEAASGINLPQLLSNAAIEGLRARRGQLVTDYQEKSETFRADYPAMAQLNNKIKEIDRQLGVEVNAVKASLKAAYAASVNQENEMKKRIEVLRAESLDLQKRSIQYNMLKREVETTRSLYESLLQRYKEVDVASGVSTNHVFIVEKAQLPGAPSSPNKSKALLIALGLGLAVGAAGAFVLEQLDDVIYSPLEAEQISGLTLLGALPKLKRGQSYQEALEDPHSHLSEALRSSCTSLHFSTGDGVPKTLMLTSATPGEGKSSTALGLARQFVATGLKVLLVDADLRNPSLHKIVSLDNSLGLSSYLTRNCEAPAAVQQIEGASLYVMTSGPLPPNPVELLHGPRFASLLSVSAEIFDVIIVDAPPVMGLADALVLSSAVRATLFVVAIGQARSRLVRHALGRLRLARGRPLGMIVTKVDTRAGHRYAYGDYGYGYGYGYGAKPEGGASGELEDASERPQKLDHGAAAA